MVEKTTGKPLLLATDLEGVYVPEVWIAFAEATGIPELRLTTRDVKDYAELMRHRLRILKEKKLTLSDIQQVISKLEPLPGAAEFMSWAREHARVVVLSDTFEEFAAPLMKKLGNPPLFCHTLETDQHGILTGWKLRIPDSKRAAVEVFKNIGFYTVAMGDSYNDTSMLISADKAFLFNAPDNVVKDFPQFPLADGYHDIQRRILEIVR